MGRNRRKGKQSRGFATKRARQQAEVFSRIAAAQSALAEADAADAHSGAAATRRFLAELRLRPKVTARRADADVSACVPASGRMRNSHHRACRCEECRRRGEPPSVCPLCAAPLPLPSLRDAEAGRAGASEEHLSCKHCGHVSICRPPTLALRCVEVIAHSFDQYRSYSRSGADGDDRPDEAWRDVQAAFDLLPPGTLALLASATARRRTQHDQNIGLLCAPTATRLHFAELELDVGRSALASWLPGAGSSASKACARLSMRDCGGAGDESNRCSGHEGDHGDDHDAEADELQAEVEDSTASSDADPEPGAAAGWEAAWASGCVGVDRRGEELATRTGCWQLRALRLESCGGDDVPAFFAALVTAVPGLRRLALTFTTEHGAGVKSALDAGARAGSSGPGRDNSRGWDADTGALVLYTHLPRLDQLRELELEACASSWCNDVSLALFAAAVLERARLRCTAGVRVMGEHQAPEAPPLPLLEAVVLRYCMGTTVRVAGILKEHLPLLRVHHKT